MRRIEMALPGVVVFEPVVHEDARGWFAETYRASLLAEWGIHDRFVQDNHSFSRGGVVRGLHYQLRRPQSKLCRVVRGEVLDVAVDIRRGSPTFGRWTAVRLSADNMRHMYLPPGYAHGFAVLSDGADMLYKCGDYYDAADARGIAWNDPGIGVDWEVCGPPTVSEADARWPRLADARPEDLPAYGDA
ncbi:MAG TPA: dTDP-4-dehydrorhamnose 3,5-epimerase [Chthonomonadales bacterium]|nr:dTDP-4-dehydrorhamnose 3,5-epimerase [Chthonomonadales bacterium]